MQLPVRGMAVVKFVTVQKDEASGYVNDKGAESRSVDTLSTPLPSLSLIEDSWLALVLLVLLLSFTVLVLLLLLLMMLLLMPLLSLDIVLPLTTLYADSHLLRIYGLIYFPSFYNRNPVSICPGIALCGSL